MSDVIIDENSAFGIEKNAGVFTFSDSHYVINKANYKMVQLPFDLYTLLTDNSRLTVKSVEPEILNQLRRLGIVKLLSDCIPSNVDSFYALN